MSRLFDSKDDSFSVFTCECGCDGCVKISYEQQEDLLGPGTYYIRNHSPLGCDPSRIGNRFDFDVSQKLELEPTDVTILRELGLDEEFPRDPEEYTPVQLESWGRFDYVTGDFGDEENTNPGDT